MANHDDHVIVLYDLANNKGVCFSPVVWRIRLMLNYKQIPYRTVFVEFQDIESTLKPLVPPHTGDPRYTVPAIHHLPDSTYIMGSVPIAEFLEATFPDPPLVLRSERGSEIEAMARNIGGRVQRISVTPREIHILSPCAQEYFRATREAALGHPLEDLLKEEDQAWEVMAQDVCDVSELLQIDKASGPFILGATPSLTDFFFSGSLQCARVVDEGIFQRYMKFPGFEGVYNACLPYMRKRD